MKLRWKKNAEETGLRRIGASPRGSYYHDGETSFASVSASGGGWRGPLEGWYWSCGTLKKGDVVIIPHANTYPKLFEDINDAKKEASEYIKKHLKEAGLI